MYGISCVRAQCYFKSNSGLQVISVEQGLIQEGFKIF